MGKDKPLETNWGLEVCEYTNDICVKKKRGTIYCVDPCLSCNEKIRIIETANVETVKPSILHTFKCWWSSIKK